MLSNIIIVVVVGRRKRWIPRIHCYKETYSQEPRDQPHQAARQESHARSLTRTFWVAENHTGAPLRQARNRRRSITVPGGTQYQSINPAWLSNSCPPSGDNRTLGAPAHRSRRRTPPSLSRDGLQKSRSQPREGSPRRKTPSGGGRGKPHPG